MKQISKLISFTLFYQVRSNRYQDPDSAYDSPNDAFSPTGEQKGELPMWLR